MAYFIVSKATNELGQRTLLATIEGRTEARAHAKSVDGTVKTAEEYGWMLNNGKIHTAEVAAVADRSGDLQAAIEAGEQQQVEAVEQENQAEADSEQAAAEAEAEAPTSPILAAAAEIAKAPRAKRTIGGKEKAAPKRPATGDDVLAQAAAHLVAFCKGNPTKVQIVRELAAWNGNALQRRDVFAVIAGAPVDLGIASATISTQFQLVRSGKAPEKKSD